jgi:AraC-like DNA-binding protein
VTDVAFGAGFQSVWQFNHLFRKLVGLSPTAYRAGRLPQSAAPLSTGPPQPPAI